MYWQTRLDRSNSGDIRVTIRLSTPKVKVIARRAAGDGQGDIYEVSVLRDGPSWVRESRWKRRERGRDRRRGALRCATGCAGCWRAAGSGGSAGGIGGAARRAGRGDSTKKAGAEGRGRILDGCPARWAALGAERATGNSGGAGRGGRGGAAPSGMPGPKTAGGNVQWIRRGSGDGEERNPTARSGREEEEGARGSETNKPAGSFQVPQIMRGGGQAASNGHFGKGGSGTATRGAASG
ncbi:hypothetical protein B0H10DRAFT_2193769 [Mycena sp. CBHHK59/15]|nr:hypothetical protein B0H10DRAFT_2193769 [Mycena sp. CBHHK59/15]